MPFGSFSEGGGGSITGEPPVSVIDGVVSLDNSAVVPGDYLNPLLTIDEKGIIQDATNGPIAPRLLQRIVVGADTNDVAIAGLSAADGTWYRLLVAAVGGAGTSGGQDITLLPNNLSTDQGSQCIGGFFFTVQSLYACVGSGADATWGFEAWLSIPASADGHVFQSNGSSIPSGTDPTSSVLMLLSSGIWADPSVITSIHVHSSAPNGIGAGTVLELWAF